MKHMFFLFIAIIIAEASVYSLYGQTQLKVWDNNGLQHSYMLLSVRKITFSDNEVIVHSNDWSQASYIMSDVFKLSFDDQSSSVESDKIANNSLSVYPNPATDVVYVNVETDLANLSVYALDGILVLQTKVAKGEPVNISLLVPGLYILRVNNQNFKVRKI